MAVLSVAGTLSCVPVAVLTVAGTLSCVPVAVLTVAGIELYTGGCTYGSWY